jgi:hypothetical protein
MPMAKRWLYAIVRIMAAVTALPVAPEVFLNNNATTLVVISSMVYKPTIASALAWFIIIRFW